MLAFENSGYFVFFFFFFFLKMAQDLTQFNFRSQIGQEVRIGKNYKYLSYDRSQKTHKCIRCTNEISIGGIGGFQKISG